MCLRRGLVVGPLLLFGPDVRHQGVDLPIRQRPACRPRVRGHPVREVAFRDHSAQGAAPSVQHLVVGVAHGAHGSVQIGPRSAGRRWRSVTLRAPGGEEPLLQGSAYVRIAGVTHRGENHQIRGRRRRGVGDNRDLFLKRAALAERLELKGERDRLTGCNLGRTGRERGAVSSAIERQKPQWIVSLVARTQCRGLRFGLVYLAEVPRRGLDDQNAMLRCAVLDRSRDDILSGARC